MALGRKNALCAGSDEGVEAWAAIASLIETAKRNGVYPQRYLTDLLTRLVEDGRRAASTNSCRGAAQTQVRLEPPPPKGAKQRLPADCPRTPTNPALDHHNRIFRNH
ncbi:transposase domain-containing protein [Roseomonas hellenica]|uniref:Transposase domain-containing protein n=1 Tax=Plastoroseomonas hellenica TaxID=2687306 RepID=A0ABS5EUL9_9PROT|nr:transposase domain-containing protein [Plastoroseomonas hellenica]